MRNLTSTKLMYLKAVLFATLGALGAVLLVLREPSVATATLVALTVWAFARAYYFAFYVIERYIDPTFRFSGLLSVARHLAKTTTSRRMVFSILPFPGGRASAEAIDSFSPTREKGESP